MRAANLLMLSAALASCGSPKSASTADSAAGFTAAAVGAQAPAFAVATLGGDSVRVGGSARQPVTLVNVWATWCAPCIKEMPELDAFDAERKDVEVIGLAYEEIAVDDMRAFLKKRPVSYPIAIVDTYEPPADFPTPRGLPMTYIIAPDERIHGPGDQGGSCRRDRRQRC